MIEWHILVSNAAEPKVVYENLGLGALSFDILLRMNVLLKESYKIVMSFLDMGSWARFQQNMRQNGR